ncbi:hypothetical protein DICPUDRAFT_74387 [Dictyostelium purpureum]|uniref:Uncharacterized protein n=1 Tax=Dictyostelium purpureum TaxID=5786 RepID=F0Z7K9_DICPU|nr:uncharacterized protein DICPUDRAFT_74387 [Dictyostelium purpureum]EGC40080.1 hypothetical protein DICPUDRAFT_74387 [Dictyostelium purpureum]|eukprot:XP_003283429.1 hypothetical protein DICPUDRAFT_74387 [Dictyostelium purpureum]
MDKNFINKNYHNTDWPLLLKSIKKGKNGDKETHFGTGFIVEAAYTEIKTNLTPIKIEKPSAEEISNRMDQMKKEREYQDYCLGKNIPYKPLFDRNKQPNNDMEKNNLYLISNDHVIGNTESIEIYFRDETKERYEVFSIQFDENNYISYGKFDSDGTKPDIGAMKLNILGTAIEHKLYKIDNEKKYKNDFGFHQEIQPVTKQETIWVAGFPFISNDEHDKWGFREPVCMKGEVIACYDQQFRFNMGLFWGSSGSLIYRLNQKKVEPLGIFSHIVFEKNNNNITTIRKGWYWELIKQLLLNNTSIGNRNSNCKCRCINQCQEDSCKFQMMMRYKII